ncbi:MAG: hypothetical protein IM574_13480 [Cytophagales bacterium]|nr:hypothetical protein [Cytophagales bacterium]MCA6434607.1 hypothetical protein [Cytophagales bacterium]
MNTHVEKPKHSFPWRWIGMILLFFICNSIFAQNTKGDKPISPFPGISQKSKPKKEKKIRSVTRDISGRRLRTKNKSAAARAVIVASFPYEGRISGRGERPGKPIGGRRATIRSSSAQKARNNVYPNRGPYVNNPSRKPRKGEQYFQRKDFQRKGRVERFRFREKSSSGAGQASARRQATTRQFFSPRKKKLYWVTSSSRGEVSSTKDISGRPLRRKNFRSPKPEITPQTDPYYGQGKFGDKTSGEPVFPGYIPENRQRERAWRGDVSKKPIRKNYSKIRNHNLKQRFIPWELPGRSKPDRTPIGVKHPASGSNFGSFRGRRKNWEAIRPFLRQGTGYAGNSKTKRPQRGAGRIWRQSRNNGGNAIAVRTPSTAAAKAGYYQGSSKRWELSTLFQRQGTGYSGDVRSRQTKKGGLGNSRSGKSRGLRTGDANINKRSRNNGGNAIAVRTPTSDAAKAGTYSGNLKSAQAHGFSDQGEGFTGFIKAKKPIKAHASFKLRSRNNGGNAIAVRIPTSGAAKAGAYSGNLKSSDVLTLRDQGEEFTGFLKLRKPKKGGRGSQRKFWNNDGKPIDVRTPLSSDAKAANYSGKIKQKEDYVQNEKASSLSIKKKEPKKGASQVEGLQVKVKQHDFAKNPRSARSSTKKREPEKGAYAAEGLQIKVKQEDYIQNRLASKSSIKKREPGKGAFAAEGLQIKVRRGKYEKNPNAQPGALRAVGPSSATVKASEYMGRMKMIWDYKHNPNSSKLALDVIRPNRAFAKGNEYQGRTRLTKNYRHNPKSSKDALKVIAPGKAYAKISNYQGNLKMSKPHGRNLHPDTKFAHGRINNVKQERTILTNAKLWWSRLFKKSETQPNAVKEKVRRPRYDKNERELWKDLYD